MSTEELPAREAMEFDVVIVGAGPAGLAAAIRLKQQAPDVSVVVVEKGSEVGAHILSGAVIDPIGLDRLVPEWRTEDTPITTAVAGSRPRRRPWASTSIPASPPPRCCSMEPARSVASPPATWGSPRTATTKT